MSNFIAFFLYNRMFIQKNNIKRLIKMSQINLCRVIDSANFNKYLGIPEDRRTKPNKSIFIELLVTT